MAHKYARLSSQELDSVGQAYNDEEQNLEVPIKDSNRAVALDYDGRSAHRSASRNLAACRQSDHTSFAGATATNPGAVTLRDRLNDSKLMQTAICSLATILLYLFLSVCLTFYQKALIKELKFPLSIVSYHLVIKLLMSCCVRLTYRCWVGKSRIQLDWRTSVRKMAPTGLASGIDIGFSNWGLELVPISLYTMTKSSTIVFILIFAIVLGLEKKNWSLVFIVTLIAVGLFMFTYKSTQFHALGFIFILVASLSGGIRWSLAQFVMQKSKIGLHNPIDMIYHMQPWMILSLLPFVIIFEGKAFLNALNGWSEYTTHHIYMVMMKISFGAVMAFCMEVSEFMVLARTSSLTLSIAGIFKDIFQLALAVEYNGDQLSVVNSLGLVLCLAGICCHITHKYSMLTKFKETENSFVLHQNDLSSNDPFDGQAGSLYSTDSNNYSFKTIKNHSAAVPLLEQTESENEDYEKKDTDSDVIFDILKRRDMQR